MVRTGIIVEKRLMKDDFDSSCYSREKNEDRSDSREVDVATRFTPQNLALLRRLGFESIRTSPRGNLWIIDAKLPKRPAARRGKKKSGGEYIRSRKFIGAGLTWWEHVACSTYQRVRGNTVHSLNAIVSLKATRVTRKNKMH